MARRRLATIPSPLYAPSARHRALLFLFPCGAPSWRRSPLRRARGGLRRGYLCAVPARPLRHARALAQDAVDHVEIGHGARRDDVRARAAAVIAPALVPHVDVGLP